MSKVNRYIRNILIVLGLVILALMVLQNAPFVQRRAAKAVTTLLEKKTGTNISVGDVRWRLPGVINIDSLRIDDLDGEPLLTVGRMGAKVEWMPLFRDGEIAVRNIRLFDLDANIHADSVGATPNYQFLIDAFKKEEDNDSTQLPDIHINTLLVRNANIHYDIDSAPQTPDVFNPNHIAIEGLNASASLKSLTADSLSVVLRDLSLTEQSGFRVDDVHFRLTASKEQASLMGLALDLPNSKLVADTLTVDLQPQLHLKGTIRPSVINPSDLAAFYPALRSVDTKLHLQTTFDGDADRIDVERFALNTPRKDIDILLDGDATLKPTADQRIQSHIELLTVTDEGWNLINTMGTAFVGAKWETTGGTLKDRVGNIAVNGDVQLTKPSSIVNLSVLSDAGAADVDASINSQGDYTATVNGQQIDVKRLLGRQDIESLSADVSMKGKVDLKARKLLTADVTGAIADLVYNNYAYAPIRLDGYYSADRINADISVNDPNADLVLHADYDTKGKQKSIALTADAEHFNPHALHLIKSHENTDFAFTADGQFSGTTLDDMRGSFVLSDFELVDDTHSWALDNFSFKAMPVDNNMKNYLLLSDFMEATVSGAFSLETIGHSLRSVLADYEPTLVSVLGKKAKASPAADETNPDQLSFHVNLTDATVLNELAGIPLTLLSPVKMDGYLIHDDLHLNASAPSIDYAGNALRGVVVDLGREGQSLRLTADGSTLNADGSSLRLGSVAHLADDAVAFELNFANAPDETLKGLFSGKASFDKDASGRLLTMLCGNRSTTVLNGANWVVEPFDALLSADHYSIAGFKLSSADQYLMANGNILTKNSTNRTLTDSLGVDLHAIEFLPLLDIIGLKGITFGGRFSGKASVAGIFSGKPRVDAGLQVENLSFLDSQLGNAVVSAGYDDEGVAFELDASEKSSDFNLIALKPDSIIGTIVAGHASLADKHLDLTVNAFDTDIAFLNSLLSSFMTDVKGRASGVLKVGGPMNHLDLEGDLFARDASFTIIPTNGHYAFNDYIRFRPGQILLSQVVANDDYYDPAKIRSSAVPGYLPHTAVVDGMVTHDGLSHWAYDINIRANNVLGLNLPVTVNESLGAKIFGDGNVHVTGSPTTPLVVDVNAKTCPNSEFSLNLGSSSETNGEFITFRDRDSMRGSMVDVLDWQSDTPRRTLHRNASASGDAGSIASLPGTPRHTVPVAPRRRRQPTTQQPSLGSEIRVNANVTNDATIHLVLDAATNDEVRAKGTGNLNILLKNGEPTLRGVFTLNRGSYHLNIQDVLRKDFEIVDGSTILFDGDPLDAQLGITAQHQVNGVSLSDLTIDAASMESVRVNCLIGIGGTPNAPELSFDLELPQGTEEQKTLLQSYTSTEEQRNLQFVYLLGLGKFYTYDYAQSASGTTGGVSTMQSLLNTTISGQINSILSGMLPSDNWTLSGNIRSDNILGQYAEEDLFNNMEVQGVLDGRLLNNRLLVNGNFGYRDNPMYASNFIGDFDIRYLLVPGSNFWVKGYNKTNDRYFSRTALTTQGIGLMFNKDFDHFFRRADDPAESAEPVAPEEPTNPATPAESADTVAPADTMAVAPLDSIR